LYNILVFPGWFPNKELVLSAIFTKKHIDIIAKTNNVSVVYAYESNYITHDFELNIDNINGYAIVICYYKPNNLLYLKKIINSYKSLKAYYLAIKALKKDIKYFDFIHIHVLTKDAILAYYYSFLRKIPVFISEHSTGYLRNNNKVIKFIKSLAINKSLGISAVSNSLLSAITNYGVTLDNLKVIPNVVDENLFLPKLLNKKSDKIKFLHVSRLDEKAKNVIGILKAFDYLFKSNKNIELNIVGGFPDQISNSESFSKSLNSVNHIFFHGIKEGEDIIPFYQDSDYFVMFSNYETQGVAVLEALFCGVPVIATDLPCFREYLNIKNSIWVPIGDLESLITKMQLCIDGIHALDSGEWIAQEIRLRFSSEDIGLQFQAFYNAGLSLLR
jgi:glycosyltransferase involved in cell wall biosynthesis